MRLLSPQLLAFLAVVKYKTVHGAAESLHLTQTAVTQRIRTLETSLSTSLFTRSRRGMLLTQEGESLLRYCQHAQELEGATLSFITGAAAEQNILLNICGPYTIMQSRIVPRCMQVMQRWPKLLLQFDINDSEDRVNTLRRGDSQLAVVEKNTLSDEMEYKDLRPEHYVLVVPHKWKGRQLREVIKNERIIDFDPRDQMTFQYLRHFGLDDLASHDRCFANRTDILAAMIAGGQGYGVLPQEFARPWLTEKKLAVLNAGKTFPHLLALAWYPRHQQPAYFSDIVQACD